MRKSEDLMAIVIAFGDAINRKDVEGAVALFAPDATIIPGNVSRLPFGEIARGEPGVRRFIAGMTSHMDIISNELDTVMVDANEVAVFTKLTANVISTGKTFTSDTVLRFTLDAEGRIARYQVHEDTHTVGQAFSSDPVPEIDQWTNALHDGLQRGDIEALRKLWSSDIRYQGPALNLNGLEERTKAEQPVLDAFTNVHVEVHRRWRDGATMVEQCTLHGDHTGALETPIGIISPTNKRVHFDYLQVVTWLNGQVVDQLISYDRVELIEQLTAETERDTKPSVK